MSDRGSAASLLVRLRDNSTREALISLASTHLELCDFFQVDYDTVEESGWRDAGMFVHWEGRVSSSLLMKVCPWCTEDPPGVNPERITHTLCDKCLNVLYPEE